MLLRKCQGLQVFEQQAHMNWKCLNYDGLWESKEFLNENQCFSWIKSIHWYQLVNDGWLTGIDLFVSMILLV